MDASMSGAQLGRGKVAGNDAGHLDRDQAMDGLVGHVKNLGFHSK